MSAHPDAVLEVESDRTRPDQSGACPCCSARELDVFYRVDSVPAHSCLLMDSRDEAEAYPRGRLDLAFCRQCGFITNVSYEPSLRDYSQRYEETQHFSAHFNNFARRLARRWVEEYGLYGKTILEIGCGKGEFLELLCTLGDNRGIGFDPGVHPERLNAEANQRIRFVKDYYSERYQSTEADAICCRHTLEHIGEPDELVAAIRNNIGDREDVVLLFELPDTTRVLRECAFWDLYYEHCSYFTSGSLARLFRRNRFDPTELQRDFDDQYLLLGARPAADREQPRFDLEKDLETTAADVAYFAEHHCSVIEQWQRRLQGFGVDGRRAVIWGGGSKGVAFLSTLKVGPAIDFVVDINPHKHGKFMPGTGHPVVGPEHLRDHRPDLVIIMNPVYMTEVRDSFAQMGFAPELVSV